ncbi:peptide-methionine (S)-S-oxide reductase [Mucilaginibacter glaciei]|uniref:peptide-methionine (S)-S-oxide reductase n=1 Tax=Mucilaginibacter glaciei TaxID=2772109 RepID=A0A926S2P9_9SPHI|nr:peptide-methionine (S)-S-oxide reductase [Mucilaginibacter glaciei]MBD1394092.1 peptide-methionine (S)-S-oxide reductase [Mucilaginibacter glaciei]
MEKIGFGGSCHWCTEAIFQSLMGVTGVQQGWIASEGAAEAFFEAVIVSFDAAQIPLAVLTAVHLHSHSCTAGHSMRSKYRSAIYTFNDDQIPVVRQAIHQLQADFEAPIITRIVPFRTFKLNREQYQNYFYNEPEKLFCQNVVKPKLRLLLDRFGDVITDRAQLLVKKK